MWIFVLKGLTTETAMSVLVVCGLLVYACALHDSMTSVFSKSFVQCLTPATRFLSTSFFHPVVLSQWMFFVFQ